MADRPIIMPRIVSRRGVTRLETVGGQTGYSDSTNTWIAGSLVKLSGGVLAAVATSASTSELICGLCPDAAVASNTSITPPSNWFGGFHFPYSLRGVRVLINLGVVKTTTDVKIGTADTAPTLADVTVGTSYGLYVPTAGTYAGYFFLDPTATTNVVCKVVEKPTGIKPYVDGAAQSTATFNPLVLVEFLDANLQA